MILTLYMNQFQSKTLIGGNTITNENRKCDNTQRGGGGQNSALLFDINECIEGDKYLNTIVNKNLAKPLATINTWLLIFTNYGMPKVNLILVLYRFHLA